MLKRISDWLLYYMFIKGKTTDVVSTTQPQPQRDTRNERRTARDERREREKRNNRCYHLHRKEEEEEEKGKDCFSSVVLFLLYVYDIYLLDFSFVYW